MVTYFRCTFTDQGSDFWKSSGGLYEAVTDDGELEETENGLTKKSDVPEVCCSKSPEAALLGAIQNRQATGTYYLYETGATPDVDISGASSRDFALLEEVRFRSESLPVQFVKYDTVQVPRKAVTDVQKAYGLGRGRFSTTGVSKVKDKLERVLKTGQYPRS